jgi:hypothetical protein
VSPTVDATMVFDHRNLHVRFLGKAAHVWNRRAVSMGTIIADHHMEIHDLLGILRELGEAADLAPLKGVVGIIQLIFDKAQVCLQSIIFHWSLSILPYAVRQ